MLQTYLGRISQAVGIPVKLQRLRRDLNGRGNYIDITENNLYDAHPEKGGYQNIEPFSVVIASPQIPSGYSKWVTDFNLCEFPGCCAFAISYNACVSDPYRNRGINNIANELRQYLAIQAGYTALICTDVDNNVAERKTLARNGWQDIYQTRNQRTNNLVNISLKELTQE